MNDKQTPETPETESPQTEQPGGGFGGGVGTGKPGFDHIVSQMDDIQENK